MASDYLSIVVHGGAKVGKTFFASSGPGRTLVLDAEAGGMRFVPGKKVVWDVESGADMPDAKDDWRICIVPVTRPSTVRKTADYLMAGRHPFNNYVIDSLTEIQDTVKRERSHTFELEQKDWGAIFGLMNDAVVGMRNMAAEQDQVHSLVVICGTQLKNGLFRPMLGGQFGDKLPYKLDAIGYLLKTRDDEGKVRRALVLGESSQHEVGHRLGDNCPDAIWEPTITKLLNAVFGTDHEEVI
jgi:hypothetical protein